MTQLEKILYTAKIHTRTFLALAVCAAIGVGGMTLAHHTGKGHVKVTQLSQRDIIEKLDGKDCQCDGGRSDLRARPEGFAAPPRRPGVRLRPGGRIRARHRRRAGQDLQGRGNVLRTVGVLCTGWPGTRAARPGPASWR